MVFTEEEIGTPKEIEREWAARPSVPVNIPRTRTGTGGGGTRWARSEGGRVYQAVYTYTPTSESEEGTFPHVVNDPEIDRLFDHGDPLPDSEGYGTPPGYLSASIDSAGPAFFETLLSLRRSVTELQRTVRGLEARINQMEPK